MARFAHVMAFTLPLLLAGATSALAQNTTPATAPSPEILTKVMLDDVRDALQNAGFRAKIEEDKNGPYMASASGGHYFYATLSECDDQNVCKSLLLETGGQTPNTPLTVDALNRFHGDNSGWAAVLRYSNGQYYASYRAALVGGVTKAWLQRTLELFATTTVNFADFMQK